MADVADIPPLTDEAKAMSRSERRQAKAKLARELRDQDPNFPADAIARMIVGRFGGTCTAKYVSELLNDPEGRNGRQRKASYRGQCRSCGAPTSGGDGPGKARELCPRCAKVKHDQDSIKATLRRFFHEQGRWPTSTDLSAHESARRGPEAQARYARYGLEQTSVGDHFGTFGAGLEAAQADETAGVPLPDVTGAATHAA